VDVFDRERVFVEKVLAPLHERYPALKLVLEHVTTQTVMRFVSSAGPTVAATITPHHLLYNRNALFAGGLRPHYYCLPVLKRERDRQALIEAATSGDPKFFLGTDSAPHPKGAKESACGCAGIFSAHAAIELYAEAFEARHALDKLEAFASRNGAAFYGLQTNSETITLVQEDWQVPAEYPLGDNTVVPLRAGQIVHWQLIGT
jgi:dihydroorotase